MKSSNLYSRIYDHSFSLLLTFSFYVIIFAVLLSCEDEEAISGINWNDNQQISTQDGTTYTVGHLNSSSSKQDSFVEKKDNKGITLWKVTHAASPLNEQAVLITLDKKNNPWVLFSLEGISADTNAIDKKFITPDAFNKPNLSQNFRQHEVGTGIAVIARLDPEDGKIVKGTFLSLPLNNELSQRFSFNRLGINAQGEVLLETKSDLDEAIQKSYSQLPAIAEVNVEDHFLKLQLP